MQPIAIKTGQAFCFNSSCYFGFSLGLPRPLKSLVLLDILTFWSLRFTPYSKLVDYSFLMFLQVVFPMLLILSLTN